MTICERMFALLDEKGLTANGLCKELGIGTGQTTNWKQRGTDPPAKYIAPICKYLDCSVEYLLTGQETKKEPAREVSRNGLEMLELFELLSERDQLLTIGRLQGLVEPMIGVLSRLRYHTPPSPIPGDASQGAAGGRSSGGKAV